MGRGVGDGGALTVGKFLIGLYLGTSAFASSYGAAGLGHRAPALGLLLGTDHPARRRVYPGIRQGVRAPAASLRVRHQGSGSPAKGVKSRSPSSPMRPPHELLPLGRGVGPHPLEQPPGSDSTMMASRCASVRNPSRTA